MTASPVIDKPEILLRIKDTISRITGVDPEDITLESVFSEDIPADSLDFTEIVMSLEDNFSVDLNDEDLPAPATVESVVELIYAAIQESGEGDTSHHLSAGTDDGFNPEDSEESEE